MMKQQHVLHQIPDYVLDLLPQSERLQIERHTIHCSDCHLALRQESDVSAMVRGTLQAAARPPANLRQFMPSPPQKRPFPFPYLTWQKQLAAVTVVLFMLLGSLGLYFSEQRGVWNNPSPTFFAATATMTDEPTTTLTQTRQEQAVEIVQTATSEALNTDIPAAPSQPQIIATPAPNPTPIAALPVKMTTN